MSRTFRTASKAAKRFLGKDKVKDGTFTRSTHSCENNGGCPYCESNRLHRHKRAVPIEDENYVESESE